MSNRTIGDGSADFAGRKIGTLRIGDIAGRDRSGQIVWHAICECGCGQTVSQIDLRKGKVFCKAGDCGKAALREAIEDTPRKERERTAGQEAQKKRQAEEREAAKIAQIEAEFTETANKIARTIKERILKGEDDGLFVDPATADATMPQHEADQFNASEAAKFLQNNPGLYYCSPKNLDVLDEYFSRNRVAIISEATLKAAVLRLTQYGLLEKRPAPVPEPEPIKVPSYVNLERDEPKETAEPTPQQQTGGEWGFDLLDGSKRFYTNLEIERMTSDQYLRVFRLSRNAMASQLRAGAYY